MGSRTHRHPRCEACFLHIEHCMCTEFRTLQTRTRLALIWHRDEQRKSTNTGRLALRTLSNSEAYVRGIQDAPVDLSPLADPQRRLLVLFPDSGARPLTSALLQESPLPVTLVVPDATWRQARTMVRREPILAESTKVIPPPGPPSRYRLRHTHTEGQLATAEAIARAFGVLEGPHAQAELERIFHIMVERTLEMRQPSRTASKT